MDMLIGFDSAWTDKRKGAISAISVRDGRPVDFDAPQLTSFDEALPFIRERRKVARLTLVALDQPTVVPNRTGLRPVERVAASVVSWLGGGVQPSNRGRIGIFCDDSPIWRFLDALGAEEEPEAARTAPDGLFLIEVFPALALASFDPSFFGRCAAPHYNPARRKTFCDGHWVRVATVSARCFSELGSQQAAAWCTEASKIQKPRKCDQDKLDSVLCLLVALQWRLKPRADSLMIGDLKSGYIVTPASAEVRKRLTAAAHQAAAARKCVVPLDGVAVTAAS